MVLRVDNGMERVLYFHLKVVRFTRKQLNRAQGFNLESNIASTFDCAVQLDIGENQGKSR